MTTERPARTVFPLRFENERTRELLRVIAERRHTSMNQLAEEMIARELQVLALGSRAACRGRSSCCVPIAAKDERKRGPYLPMPKGSPSR